MSDDDEIEHVTEIERVANGKPSHFDMNEAFRVRMLKAIAAGLEKAPIGVVTTPGTKNPRYVPTEPRLLGFSLVEMDVWFNSPRQRRRHLLLDCENARNLFVALLENYSHARLIALCFSGRAGRPLPRATEDGDAVKF